MRRFSVPAHLMIALSGLLLSLKLPAAENCSEDPERLKAVILSDDSTSFFAKNPACVQKFAAFVKLGKIKLELSTGNSSAAETAVPFANSGNSANPPSIPHRNPGQPSSIQPVTAMSAPSGVSNNAENEQAPETPPVRFYGNFKDPSAKYQSFEYTPPVPQELSDAPGVVEFRSMSNKKAPSN